MPAGIDWNKQENIERLFASAIAAVNEHGKVCHTLVTPDLDRLTDKL